MKRRLLGRVCEAARGSSRGGNGSGIGAARVLDRLDTGVGRGGPVKVVWFVLQVLVSVASSGNASGHSNEIVFIC